MNSRKYRYYAKNIERDEEHVINVKGIIHSRV